MGCSNRDLNKTTVTITIVIIIKPFKKLCVLVSTYIIFSVKGCVTTVRDVSTNVKI